MHLSYRGIRYLFSGKAAQNQAPEATIFEPTTLSAITTDGSIILAYRGIPYRLSTQTLQHSATEIPSAVIPLAYRGIYYLSERFTLYQVEHGSLESSSGSTEQG